MSKINYGKVWYNIAKQIAKRIENCIGISFYPSKRDGIQLLLIMHYGDLIDYKKIKLIPFSKINDINLYIDFLEKSGCIKVQNIVGYTYNLVDDKIFTYLIIKNNGKIVKKPLECIDALNVENIIKHILEEKGYIPIEKVEKTYKGSNKNDFKKLRLARDDIDIIIS